MVCSIAGVLDAVGDRWAMLILRDLSLGLSKYEELRQSTDITHATLSDRLKHLEENELIERRRYQTGPERFEYVLTRKGSRGVKLALVDEKSGELVRLRDVYPEAGPGADDLVRWRLTKFGK
jgi:DNA-binding HxlR family transcriptional regulator